MDIITLSLFGTLGGGISYMDRAYDDGVFSKVGAGLLAPFMVLIWLFLATSDTVYATLLFAILFSSLASGKVDTLIYKACAVAIILALGFNWPGALVPSLLILTILGIADEKANDHFDNMEIKGGLGSFFAHRSLMKLGVLGLAWASVLPWTSFWAILTFDIAYDGVVVVGARLEPGGDENQNSVTGGS